MSSTSAPARRTAREPSAARSPQPLGMAVLAWFARDLVRNTLLYLLAVILIAAGIYTVVEGDEIGYLDGIWWAVVTLTTVGYGDIAPASAGMRIVAVWVIASGIVSVAVLTGWIAGRIAVAAIIEADRTPGIDDDFTALTQDLTDAAARVQALQERFRLDERGDDRVAEAARRLIHAVRSGDEAARRGALRRLEEAVREQELTDA